MNRIVGLMLVCLLLAGWKAEARNSVFQIPADPDQVDVYLHSVDIGNLLYSNFGHNALRVHDRATGSDLVFNWGMYTFGDPIAFGLNFYRGILHYSLGIYPYRTAVEWYKYERRKVWEDKVQLTREQKQKLFQNLWENSQPENLGFDYQYFFDNCSTRLRNQLDEAMGGAVQARTHNNHSAQTFRDMVYEGFSYTPGMDVFLDIAMNSRLDRLMTVWEQTFHPLYLRQVYQQTGNAGQPLLTDSHVLVDFPRPESYPGLAFMLVLLVWGVPLSLFCVAFFMLEKWARVIPPALYRLFALTTLPLLSFGALIGFLMPVTWAVSAHLDLHHNANMLLFWPLDIILLVWAFALLVRGRAWRLSEKWALILRRYVLAHMVGTLLLPVLRILGLIQQDVNRIVVWVLPPYMVILFLLWRLGTSSSAGQRA